MTPLPAGTGLGADHSFRRRDGGRLLIGGSPLRFMRVSEAGAKVVSGWLAGKPVGDKPGPTTLARRLIAAGMMHPIPPRSAPCPALTVIIPVKDDGPGLTRTLASLPSDADVIIVDDGSALPVERPQAPGTGPTTAAGNIEVLRRPTAGGPGQARQSALGRVTTPLVAFIDAGVELSPGALDALGAWFNDPEVVAVGPRIACTPAPDRLSEYEQEHSPLDLGPNPSPVRADAAVTYLPTACLLARTEAVDAAGGFDPGLRWGEDVDLIWRLTDAGEIRYDPSIVVTHPARATLQALLGQRVAYGSSAGPLGVRHGSRVAPARLSGWSLACWSLIFAGHAGPGLLLGGYTAVALERKLRAVLPDSEVEAALLTARGHWHAGRSLARTATRAWWPLTAVAALIGPRRLIGRIVALSLLDRLLGASGPLSERLEAALLGTADDAAYGAGVWLGAARSRSLDALLPTLSNWPPDDDA